MTNSAAEAIPSASVLTPDAGRWAPLWVILFVALWPTPGLAETVLSLGALFAAYRLLHARFRGGTRLLSGAAWALTSVLFFAYWLPQMLSAFDAVDVGRALRKAATDLRYLPFMWLCAIAVANAQRRRRTFTGLAVIGAVWTLDALLQAAFGNSPLFFGLDQIKQLISGHGLCTPQELALVDRLSGVLGPCNLKFGQTLASLSPFLLLALGRRHAWAWAGAAAAVGVVLVLAGSRASWITYGVIVLLSGWQLLGGRRLLGVALIGALLAAGVVAVAPQARADPAHRPGLRRRRAGRRPGPVRACADLGRGVVHDPRASAQWRGRTRISAGLPGLQSGPRAGAGMGRRAGLPCAPDRAGNPGRNRGDRFAAVAGRCGPGLARVALFQPGRARRHARQ